MKQSPSKQTAIQLSLSEEVQAAILQAAHPNDVDSTTRRKLYSNMQRRIQKGTLPQTAIAAWSRAQTNGDKFKLLQMFVQDPSGMSMELEHTITTEVEVEKKDKGT
eukprot:5654072-Amphidinium_carterae.1